MKIYCVCIGMWLQCYISSCVLIIKFRDIARVPQSKKKEKKHIKEYH